MKINIGKTITFIIFVIVYVILCNILINVDIKWSISAGVLLGGIYVSVLSIFDD